MTFSWKSPISWPSRFLENVPIPEKVRIHDQVTFSWKSPNSWTSRFQIFHFFIEFIDKGDRNYRLGMSGPAITGSRCQSRKKTTDDDYNYFTSHSDMNRSTGNADDDNGRDPVIYWAQRVWRDIIPKLFTVEGSLIIESQWQYIDTTTLMKQIL